MKIVTALLFLIQLTESLTTHHVIYVTPDNNPGICPEGEDCKTLQQCIENEKSCFKNHTKMILLEGNHSVTTSDEYTVTLHDLHNFTMIGNGTISGNATTPPDPNNTIVCSGSIGFQFRFSSNLNFTNLGFEKCGTKVAINVTHVQAAIAFFVVTNLTIESVSIKNSAGFGIHAEKAYGNVMISHSIFSGNKGYSHFYGGNAHFWYKGCRQNTSANVTIRNSWFMNSTNSEIIFANNSNATGLEVMVDCPYIHIQIQNITAVNNTASKGGNLAIAFVDRHKNTAHVSIQDSSIGNGSADRGGGLTVWSEIDLASNETISCGFDDDDRVILEITNTDFNNNYANKDGGALYIGHYEKGKVDCIVRKIKFVNCRFVGNKVNWLGSGAAALITKYETEGYIPHPEPQFEVGFHNCTFTEHDFQFDGQRKADIHLHGIINALSVGKLLVNGSRFTDNKSTAISLLSSNLILEGNVRFQNNTAYNGGALEFCTSSVIIIKNDTDTNIEFINNHALKAGGAIYAQEPCLDTVPACFFQPVTTTITAPKDCESLSFTMSLTFINNTAGEAGDAIFNGAIDYCYLLYNHHIHLGSKTAQTWSNCTFEKIFDVSQQIALNSTSYISSEPHRVCLCPDYQNKDCSVISYTYPNEVFPGEMFNISAVAVGQRSGIVPAVVEAYLVDTDSGNHNNTLSGTTVVKSGKQCTNLTVAVASNDSSVFFNLSVQAQNWKYTQYPQVNVTLVKCPMGFTNDNGSKTCVCDEKLRTKWKLSCNGDSFKYTRLEPIWVGIEEFSTCTYDYCNLSILNEEYDLMVGDDIQCDFNRTGRVCGACKLNYSVVLGSSRCLQCSNKLLVPLLVAFAFAGIALFALLFIFNFTVTEGTINGFIMYANIVHLNHNIFFPGNKFPPLSVLIAWFNLDLGIETCFFEGMDDYTKLWLQFGFIGYIWIIGALIILLSRKYIFVTRCFGRNATKVLATLFLLSFTKVIRNISKSVSFTLVQDTELIIRHFVCDFDGNVLFLYQKHIPLYIFACLLMLIFTFFAMALTLIQCLQKSSTFRPLRWVEKFRPFFEAFTGPCRDNYRFWPGLLFMCRAALITIDSVYHNPQDSVLKVAVITAVFMFLLCLGCVTPKGVYNKWQLNILECSFFLNIIITCIVLLINQSIKKNLIPFSYLYSIGHLFTTYMYCSTSLAVLTFIGILIFHAYTQLKTSRLPKACIKFIRQKRRRVIQAPEPQTPPQSTPSSDRPTTSIVTMEDSIGESLEESTGESTPLLAQSMPPVVCYTQYREPLIADDD